MRYSIASMSGVDQLFDRFGDLLKSWVRSDGIEPPPFSDPFRRSGSAGDPALDEAMAELDAYLDDDRAAQERLRREREARDRAEERAHATRSGAPSGPPPRLVAAYSTLGLSYGATFEQTKAAYKRLLKEHHPDKHGSSPEAQKKATETSARINDAFRLIEAWRDTGTLGDE